MQDVSNSNHVEYFLFFYATTYFDRLLADLAKNNTNFPQISWNIAKNLENFDLKKKLVQFKKFCFINLF